MPPTDPPSTKPATLVGPLPEPTVDVVEIATADSPTGTAVRPGDNRVFVVEQAGRVRAIDSESDETVLDITALVGDAGGEQGLLGLAFDPTDDLAYVNYTDDSGNSVVAELAVTTKTP
jgi:hypothetical protein